MYLYIIVLAFILLNGRINGKNRKKYIITSFGVIILLAALRKYTVGTDLAGHYADRFVTISYLRWDQIHSFYVNHTYDLGFVVFDKLLGCISHDPQIFIIVTSLIIYGSAARYIYRHSEDVVLETFLFVTSFTMMMYLNIIAQAMAIAVMLWGMDYLMERKYFRYILVICLAACLHSSAWICILFSPLMMVPNTKRWLVGYVLILFGVLLGINQILRFVTKNIFQQFSVYLSSSSYHGAGISLSGNSLFQISMHLLALIITFLFLYHNGKTDESQLALMEKRRSLLTGKIEEAVIPQLSTNFLVYMSLSAAVFRFLAYRSYIITRMGFYVYLFSFSLLARAVSGIRLKSNRMIVKPFVYLYMIGMFLLFYKSAGMKSYGTLPYLFFWQ